MNIHEENYKVFEIKTAELIERKFGRDCKYDPRVIETQIHTELFNVVKDIIANDPNDPAKKLRTLHEYTDKFFEEHYHMKGVGSR